MGKDIRDVRQYFSNFRISRLTSCEKNKEIIADFMALESGNELERYLKEDAWEADSKGETCVYLVFDENSRVAAFFSLKCGLLYTKNEFDNIPDDEIGLFEDIVKALSEKDYDTVEGLKAGFDNKADEMVELARKKLDLLNSAEYAKEDKNSSLVQVCCPALELQHFCKNIKNHKNKYRGIPLGFGIFWEKIVPQIDKIIKIVGCQYLYLFAADQTDTEDIREKGKLIRYYKSNLNFQLPRGLLSIKPNYDLGCVAMHQKADSLMKVREEIWERFSDNITSE